MNIYMKFFIYAFGVIFIISQQAKADSIGHSYGSFYYSLNLDSGLNISSLDDPIFSINESVSDAGSGEAYLDHSSEVVNGGFAGVAAGETYSYISDPTENILSTGGPYGYGNAARVTFDASVGFFIVNNSAASANISGTILYSLGAEVSGELSGFWNGDIAVGEYAQSRARVYTDFGFFSDKDDVEIVDEILRFDQENIGDAELTSGILDTISRDFSVTLAPGESGVLSGGLSLSTHALHGKEVDASVPISGTMVLLITGVIFLCVVSIRGYPLSIR